MPRLNARKQTAYEWKAAQLSVASSTKSVDFADPAAVPLNHPALIDLLQRAYSAEKAASYAYIGHAGSLRNATAKAAVKQIEEDEWAHRAHVLALMKQYGVPVSHWYELKYAVIGRLIAGSCYVIGWFMPIFFAGKLESGNVCEYFVMMHHFHALGIREHDAILYEMGMKEKEHEVYFLGQIKDSRLLPFFERVFAWGSKASLNDVRLDAKYPVPDSHRYCTARREGEVKAGAEVARQNR